MKEIEKVESSETKSVNLRSNLVSVKSIIVPTQSSRGHDVKTRLLHSEIRYTLDGLYWCHEEGLELCTSSDS